MLFTNQVNKFLEKAETEDSLNQEDEIEASLRRIKKFKRLIHLLYSSKARKKRRKLSVIKQGTPDQTIADHKDDVKKMIMLMTIESKLIYIYIYIYTHPRRPKRLKLRRQNNGGNEQPRAEDPDPRGHKQRAENNAKETGSAQRDAGRCNIPKFRVANSEQTNINI